MRIELHFRASTSRNDCDKKAREFCLNNCKNNFVKQRLEGEHVPDIPLLRYGIALALLSITPAISKWAQCSASTNSCEGWEKVQSSPTIIYPYQRTKTKKMVKNTPTWNFLVMTTKKQVGKERMAVRFYLGCIFSVSNHKKFPRIAKGKWCLFSFADLHPISPKQLSLPFVFFFSCCGNCLIKSSNDRR